MFKSKKKEAPAATDGTRHTGDEDHDKMHHPKVANEGSAADLHDPEFLAMEEDVVKAFIAHLAVLYPGGVRHGDEPRFLLRFLRARRYHIEKASALFKNFIAWESGLSQKLNICHARAMLESEVIQLQGNKDKLGRTILFMQPAKFFPGKVSPHTLMAAAVYLLELAIQSESTQVEGFTLMMDLAHIGFSNFSIEYVRTVFDTLQNRFPARVRTAILIDAPMIYNVVWSFVRPWLNAYQAAKVQTVKRNKLSAFIDEDQIPVSLGGTFNFSMAKFIEDRYTAEGFDYADQSYKTIAIPNVSGAAIAESTGFETPETESKKAVLKKSASAKR
eukprot:TRINITY_DN11560_c0_g1_i1.p1 TRINITY_DN11560_c0_g1~~TRINITY_DN11560_c0_g1_i1.p1  ORF type:complete len:331 (-),score=36.39 TRINITY_DN11560_c0_g1_i1:123-1115(-)